MIIPSYIGKINYIPQPNQYTIVYSQTVVDSESSDDLKDKKHLAVVKRARDEYKKGLLIEEGKILKKLNLK